MDITSQITNIRRTYEQLGMQMAQPEIASDPSKYSDIAREHARLGRIIEKADQLQKMETELKQAREIIAHEENEEMRTMAEEEAAELEVAGEQLNNEIQVMLIPPDPYADKNIIMEIRAGTGGDEAGLFVGDLFRMYSHFAERKKWKVEILEKSEQGVGGFKEIVFSISGSEVYLHLQFEKGVHRVQRVPVTESSGRLHTSAVTVAVLPEAEEKDIAINPNDLRIDTFRAGGHGGQSVNTTDSAVRIIHLPTEIVVTCQDERSQHKNRARALRVLRSRLLEYEIEKQHAAEAADRKLQVGSGDRSERIRTYNFPQNRLSDHRINLTLYSLDNIMQGALDDVIDALLADYNNQRLRELEVSVST